MVEFKEEWYNLLLAVVFFVLAAMYALLYYTCTNVCMFSGSTCVGDLIISYGCVIVGILYTIAYLSRETKK